MKRNNLKFNLEKIVKFNFKSIFFFIFIVLLLSLQFVLIAIIPQDRYLNHLADAFLHGQLNFLDQVGAKIDFSFFNNKYFWPGGPLLGVILMPFVFLFGTTFSTSSLAIIINLINFFCFIN